MIEQNYNLNTIPSASPVPIVHVSQYDKGSRTLKFKLFEGSGEYSMASVNGAKINGKKPDGNEFSYNMTIAGNVVSVDVTEQMTAVAGRVVSEIVLSGANGAVLGTANFIIEVEESPIDGGVISDTDVPVIVDFVVGGNAGQFFRRTETGGEWVDYIPSGASWGTITGNLADQTDLNNKFSEINNNISQKANTSDVNSALALKANTSDVNTALATKADASSVNTLAGSLAMVETSPATANHAVGNLIVFNNQLYKVTVAIASGEALMVGKNIASTSVGNELNNNCIVSESLTSLGNNKYNMSFNIPNSGFYVATCNCRCYGGGTYPEIISVYSTPDCSGDAVGGGVTTKEYGFVSFPMYTYFERGTHYLSFHNKVASDYFNARVALFRIGNT